MIDLDLRDHVILSRALLVHRDLDPTSAAFLVERASMAIAVAHPDHEAITADEIAAVRWPWLDTPQGDQLARAEARINLPVWLAAIGDGSADPEAVAALQRLRSALA